MGGHSHNVPIEILTELGLFGFVLFSIAIFTLILQAFTGSNRKQMDQSALNNFTAIFACWVFALLLSCKQGTVIFSIDVYMYAVLAEKSLRLSALNTKKRSHKGRAASLRRSRLTCHCLARMIRQLTPEDYIAQVCSSWS